MRNVGDNAAGRLYESAPIGPRLADRSEIRHGSSPDRIAIVTAPNPPVIDPARYRTHRGSSAALAALRAVHRQPRHGARGRAAPRHRHARRAGAARRASPISATPIRPRPRAAAWCRACSAPSTASTRSSCKGLALPADPRLRGREPDGARLRRAVHALRPARPHGRDRRGAQLRHLHARSRGALLRRQAGHARRT